jgi:hypothetical protein
LVVLVRGRFGLEVIGEGEEWTLAIGELFLSRLVGPWAPGERIRHGGGVR